MEKGGKKSLASSLEPTLRDVMGVLNTMTDWMKGTDVRLTNLEQGQNKIRVQIDDVQETLDAVARAVDKDAVSLLDHERRITRLERAH